MSVAQPTLDRSRAYQDVVVDAAVIAAFYCVCFDHCGRLLSGSCSARDVALRQRQEHGRQVAF